MLFAMASDAFAFHVEMKRQSIGFKLGHVLSLRPANAQGTAVYRDETMRSDMSIAGAE